MNERIETIKRMGEKGQPIPLEVGLNLIGGMVQLAMIAEKRMAEILRQNTSKPSMRRQEEFANLDKIEKMFNSCYDQGMKEVEARLEKEAKANGQNDANAENTNP